MTVINPNAGSGLGPQAYVFSGMISVGVGGGITNQTTFENSTGTGGAWSHTTTGTYRVTWGQNNMAKTIFTGFQRLAATGADITYYAVYELGGFPLWQLNIQTYKVDLTANTFTVVDMIVPVDFPFFALLYP